jgi:hypothetical protein
MESRTQLAPPRRAILLAANISQSPYPAAMTISWVKTNAAIPELTAASAAKGSDTKTNNNTCDQSRPGTLESSGKPSTIKMQMWAKKTGSFTNAAMNSSFAPSRLCQR